MKLITPVGISPAQGVQKGGNPKIFTKSQGYSIEAPTNNHKKLQTQSHTKREGCFHLSW